jgi:hypothetical protein
MILHRAGNSTYARQKIMVSTSCYL